jgi:hypothetical protein
MTDKPSAEAMDAAHKCLFGGGPRCVADDESGPWRVSPHQIAKTLDAFAADKDAEIARLKSALQSIVDGYQSPRTAAREVIAGRALP